MRRNAPSSSPSRPEARATRASLSAPVRARPRLVPPTSPAGACACPGRCCFFATGGIFAAPANQRDKVAWEMPVSAERAVAVTARGPTSRAIILALTVSEYIFITRSIPQAPLVVRDRGASGCRRIAASILTEGETGSSPDSYRPESQEGPAAVGSHVDQGDASVGTPLARREARRGGGAGRGLTTAKRAAPPTRPSSDPLWVRVEMDLRTLSSRRERHANHQAGGANYSEISRTTAGSSETTNVAGLAMPLAVTTSLR